METDTIDPTTETCAFPRAQQPSADQGGPRLVSVVDIGTTSIRMTVAEIDAEGGVNKLESLSQPVNLGRDTFTTGGIKRDTIKQCVRILNGYRSLLEEYRILDPADVRIVATTAVSEASNQTTFLDRILVATGFAVEVIARPEVDRLTFLGTLPLLESDPDLTKGRLLMAKIGGGSISTLHMDDGEIVHTHSFREGSLRLRGMLEVHEAPLSAVRTEILGHIDRVVEEIHADMPASGGARLLALGRDIRIATASLIPDWDAREIVPLPLASLESYMERVLSLSIEEIAIEDQLTLPEAGTLGPALLTWVRLARNLGCETLYVSSKTMRDGLLREMVVGGVWAEVFLRHLISVAIELGRRFRFDEVHARQTAEIASQLFHALREEHQLPKRCESLLHLAALLHDIGYVVANQAHHKHSMYLILNSGLFGLGERDLLAVALVARYHRRAVPRPSHPEYSRLDPADRLEVSKMAALLRIAEALDASDSQRIREIEVSREADRLIISIPNVDDLLLEQLAVKRKGRLFEDIFGLKVQLRTA